MGAWRGGGDGIPGVEVSLGIVPLSLSLTMSSTCPVSPLRGRKSMGPVHCIFRKRNAVLERA